MNLVSLQLAWLAAGLVQIHTQIPTVPVNVLELNVGGVIGERLEMTGRRVDIRHLREVIRRVLIGKVIAVRRNLWRPQSEDVKAPTLSRIRRHPVICYLRIIAVGRERILSQNSRSIRPIRIGDVGHILCCCYCHLGWTGEILRNAYAEVSLILNCTTHSGHMVIFPSGPGKFRLNGDDGSIHKRASYVSLIEVWIDGVSIGCSLDLQDPRGREVAQTARV